MKNYYSIISLILISNLSLAQGFLGADKTVCGDEKVTLSAGSGYMEYIWSNEATTSTISVPSGNYNVERRKAGTSILDISQTDNGATTVYSANYGQSFKPTRTGYIDIIQIEQAPNQVACTVNLRVGTGASADGSKTILGTQSVTFASTTSTQTRVVNFTINTKIFVVKGQTYTFYFASGGQHNLYLKTGYQTAYTNGSVFLNGSAKTDYDLKFKIYIKEATVQTDAIKVLSSGPCPTTDPTPTTVLEGTSAEKLAIYPNPVYGNSLNIEGNYTHIELYNFQGVLVAKLQIINNKVVLPQLNNGIYLVKAQTTEGDIISDKLYIE